jgi:hypothetical protein
VSDRVGVASMLPMLAILPPGRFMRLGTIANVERGGEGRGTDQPLT